LLALGLSSCQLFVSFPDPSDVKGRDGGVDATNDGVEGGEVDGTVRVGDANGADGGTISDASAPEGDPVIFVTSQGVQSAFGGRDAANVICQNAADSNGSVVRGRKWQAWLSTNEATALESMKSQQPLSYQRVDGNRIGTLGDIGMGFRLAFPIQVTELNTTIDAAAWTGPSFADAAEQGGTCLDWTTNQPSHTGVIGESTSLDSWTYSQVTACGQTFSLYCVEMR
jgi:hypothetical protein